MMVASALITTLMSALPGMSPEREKGATAVEYGIMVALIALVIIAAVTLLGGNLSSLFDALATKLTTLVP